LNPVSQNLPLQNQTTCSKSFDDGQATDSTIVGRTPESGTQSAALKDQNVTTAIRRHLGTVSGKGGMQMVM
ncbi:hypothetical protein, partial [Pseudotabrizicola sediminis]|uniref:hypothetical protein n=1 Tax=Pseudotabrizicola sediminis TaxID=2486418 RepID=UPI001AEBC4BB